MSSDVIDQVSNKLDAAEGKLDITIRGAMYASLVRLSRKMRNTSTPKDVVEIALELIVKAEDKEVVLMDQGRIVANYDLWRR